MEVPVRRSVALLAVMALLSCAGSVLAPCSAQTPATDDTPAFYRLVPGTYVNGWPRFTVTYPKDWVEALGVTFQAFRAKPLGKTGDAFNVALAGPGTLDKAVEDAASLLRMGAMKDVTIVRDKPTQLSNGVPAREGEIRGIRNGLPFSWACLAVKHGDVVIFLSVESRGDRIEDLKTILHSLRYELHKDKPVKVPPDVQEFLDSLSSAWVARDLPKVMYHYSDRYLNSGIRKGEMERYWRQGIGSVTAHTFCITEFVPAGDTAHLAGFTIRNGVKNGLRMASITRENGKWKWYGNQREVAP